MGIESNWQGGFELEFAVNSDRLSNVILSTFSAGQSSFRTLYLVLSKGIGASFIYYYQIALK